MGAFDLVFLKACSVLPQVDALQPVSHVVLVPQVEGLLVKRPKGQEWRTQPGRMGRRGGRGARAGTSAGAPHDEAHLFGLLGQAEAGGFKDGLRGCGR